MIEGFCLTHQADVPITDTRRCIEDGDLVIPPTWAGHTDAFPWPERPDGYTYRPPAYLREYQKKLTDSIGKHRKPAPKQAVGATLDKKLRPPKPVQRTGQAYVTFTCGGCHTTVTKKAHGGPRQRFCNDVCRNRGYRRGERPVMATEGRACVDCKRDDVPHRAHGRCAPCSLRLRRQTEKARAVA